MKLISTFKDYYDYNIGLYGIDEKVVYNRLPFKDDFYHTIAMSDLPKGIPKLFSWSYSSEWDYAYLLVCGRVYYIKRRRVYNAQYELIPEADVREMIRDMGRTWFPSNYYTVDYSKVLPQIMDIHKVTKQPVVVMQGYSNRGVSIDVNIPVLKEIKGFAGIVGSKQCYLDITQCLIDLNNTEGSPAMTDTDKIVSHGFDKKISFRHRK